MRCPLLELPIVRRSISEVKISMPLDLAILPVAFVEPLSFLGTDTVDIVVGPFAFVQPSVCVVIQSVSFPLSVPHLSFVSLSVGVNDNSFSVVDIVIPFSEINVPIATFEDARSLSLSCFGFALIGLVGAIIAFLYIKQELSIRRIDIVFEKGLNNALFLLL